jgi:hypothetical protein
MTTAAELIREGNKEKIWNKYCGFLDLDIKSYMQIQNRLLLEQISIIKDSNLGKHFFGKKAPTNIDEFRKKVPLTLYEDYVPFLLEKSEKDLPPGNYVWARTSGKSGKYPCKWVPYTDRIYEKLGEVVVGAVILSSCKYKGDINIEPGDVALLMTAPLPYTSGYISRATDDQLDMRFVPPLEEGEKMGFADRISTGFKLAMEYGLDMFFGLASVLGKMGERFESGSASGSFSLKDLRPRAFFRLLGGFLKAKLQKRNLLPKDIWKIKSIMTGGMDTDIYRDRIEYYWGRKPLEGYASTEGGMCGMQSWSFKGMTFFPDCNLYEFIPFNEHLKLKADPKYEAKTLLMDELTPGIYEIVFTNFFGGALMRYRIGDLVEVIALEDEETGVKLPQFNFYSRADDLIDIGNMARFTETSIWRAIDNSGVTYEDWTARKEQVNGNTVLHIYLELKGEEKRGLPEIESILFKKMKEYHSDFMDMEEIFGDDQFKVSLLPVGAFGRYIDLQLKAGSDLAHIKPAHMQPKEVVMERLLKED